MKHTSPPLCRYCGEPIRKQTSSIYFKKERTQYDHTHRYIGYAYVGDQEWPRSKADAQRFVNGKVLSVQYYDLTHIAEPKPGERPGDVKRITTWDGEEYVDDFFCNGDHARKFAYVFAHAGHSTTSYADAMKRGKVAK